MRRLFGTVTAGRGTARSHITEHAEEIARLIGTPPFPGSLNVVLDKPIKLDAERGKSFDNGQRWLWPGTLNEMPVWLYRWYHAPLHIVEVISPYPLRRELGLADGQSVHIDVEQELVDRAPLISWALMWAGRRSWYYGGDRYAKVVGDISRMTGLGIERPPGVVRRTVRGIKRRLGIGATNRPYAFQRKATSGGDHSEREAGQIENLLNYTKTSDSSYSAGAFPAGYHTIDLNGVRLKGQRDPAARLADVPFDFAGKSVLDLGSNQGGMLFQVADRASWCVGVDYDSRMVNAANRIRAAKGADNTSFYVFDLEKEDLQLIRDFLPGERVDICFLLSVCMWLKNWRDVIDFVASVSDAVLFETNGTVQQQDEQVEKLRSTFAVVEQLTDSSPDDPGQKSRRLLIASHS